MSSTAKGVFIGGSLGSSAGLGACMWLIPDDWTLFPGDTMLAGALICGMLGYVYGEAFIEWMLDRSHWF